jgi:hypothetical protein
MFFQKAVECAQQATEQDRVHNYEAAATNYMTAADWVLHAMKC